MTNTTDYDPIAAQEVIEKPKGILGRRKQRTSLKPTGYGFERVFVDQDGVVQSAKGPVTAGERYWTPGGTWLSVDISDHLLTCEVPHRDIDGSASYEIKATATVCINDAAEAVRRKIRSVQAYIEPALRTAIYDGLASFTTDRSSPELATQPSPHNVAKLNVRRGDLEQKLRERLRPGARISIEDWLDVKLADISVTFDAETMAHINKLVSMARDLEVDEADREQRIGWETYFEPRLAVPLKRAIQILAADASKENVEHVVGIIGANEQLQNDEVVRLLNILLEKNYVEDVGQLKGIRALLDNLILPTGGSDKALVNAGPSDLTVTTAEVIDSDENIARGFDRSWNDDVPNP